MNYTEEQLSKLPKWAQQEIKCLTQIIKTIDVNTDSRSGGTLVIKPRSANSFYIEFTN